MYHRVAELYADPQGICVAPERFAEHLAVIKGFGRVLSLGHLVETVRHGALPERSVIVTFDDGYADNLVNAVPLMRQFDVPATMFVSVGNIGSGREFWWDELVSVLLRPNRLPRMLHLSVHGADYHWDLGRSAHFSEKDSSRHRDWRASGTRMPTMRHALYCSLHNLLKSLPEEERREAMKSILAWAGQPTGDRLTNRCMTVEEVCELSHMGLIEIGAHALSHVSLANLDKSSQMVEIQQSKVELEEIICRPVLSFSYPYGSHSAETVEIVRSAGYHYACDAAPGLIRHSSDLFLLPRMMVKDWTGEEFGRRLHRWLED